MERQQALERLGFTNAGPVQVRIEALIPRKFGEQLDERVAIEQETSTACEQQEGGFQSPKEAGGKMSTHSVSIGSSAFLVPIACRKFPRTGKSAGPHRSCPA